MGLRTLGLIRSCRTVSYIQGDEVCGRMKRMMMILLKVVLVLYIHLRHLLHKTGEAQGKRTTPLRTFCNCLLQGNVGSNNYRTRRLLSDEIHQWWRKKRVGVSVWLLIVCRVRSVLLMHVMFVHC